MGVLDRLKRAVLGSVEVRDPNPVLHGRAARGEIVSTSGTVSGTERVIYAHKKLEVVVIGEPHTRTWVECWLSEAAHRRAIAGSAIPVLLSDDGAILGVDVPAWEAEVAALDRP